MKRINTTKQTHRKYGTDVPTTFYDMGYQEHPVYLDPGSKPLDGNQDLGSAAFG